MLIRFRPSRRLLEERVREHAFYGLNADREAQQQRRRADRLEQEVYDLHECVTELEQKLAAGAS